MYSDRTHIESCCQWAGHTLARKDKSSRHDGGATRLCLSFRSRIPKTHLDTDDDIVQRWLVFIVPSVTLRDIMFGSRRFVKRICVAHDIYLRESLGEGGMIVFWRKNKWWRG